MAFSKTTSVTQYGNGITKRSVSINNGHGNTYTRTVIQNRPIWGGYNNGFTPFNGGGCYPHGGRRDFTPFNGGGYYPHGGHHHNYHRPHHNHRGHTGIALNSCGLALSSATLGLSIGGNILSKGWNFIKGIFGK